ncbi:hypothetical protein FB446DRAFT_715845 [Lentinula raphanica]|nr:hypothetical protein FB446DRAFT_715845 [Lentinula raphanica]
MPAKSRIFSEMLAEEAENGSRNFQHRDAANQAKRRKTGLNSKFDRMVEAMNITYRSPKERQRTRSSSVSSYGVPQTPVDAYAGLQAGALGQDFSVIKLGPRTDLEVEDEEPSQVSQDAQCTVPLPGWLSETFTTLAKKHPLRLLLPSSMRSVSAEVRDGQTSNESQAVFAFSPPPIPAQPSNALQSPIAFRARTVPEISAPARLETSPPLRFEPFSTPGPASSIRQPSPSKPFASTNLFSEVQPYSTGSYGLPSPQQAHVHDSQEIDKVEFLSEISNRLSSEQMNLPISSIALAPSMLTSTRQDPYFNTASRNYDEHEVDAQFPPSSALAQFSRPSILAQQPYLPVINQDFEDSQDLGVKFNQSEHFLDAQPSVLSRTSTLPEMPCFPLAHIESEFPEESNHNNELTNAFTTPGPAYISSRPVYYDTPTDDPSSDPPDPSYQIDQADIDFQWTPFDRKVTKPFEHDHFNKPLLPIIPEPETGQDIEDLASLPPSSDQPTAEDSNPSISALRSKTGSDHELPLASSSSDSPVVNEETGPQGDRRNIVAHSVERKLSVDRLLPEAPPSPGPFRFIPPSRSPSLAQNETINLNHNALQRHLTSSARGLPTDGHPTAASPAVSSDLIAKNLTRLPNFGYASRRDVEDFDTSKNDLLNTLDKIAPDSPIHGAEVDSREETDSIESWSQEQEQELLQLGL